MGWKSKKKLNFKFSKAWLFVQRIPIFFLYLYMGKFGKLGGYLPPSKIGGGPPPGKLGAQKERAGTVWPFLLFFKKRNKIQTSLIHIQSSTFKLFMGLT